MSKKWYRFTENNEHEGETWNVFIELSPREWELLADTIKKCEAEGCIAEGTYKLSEKTFAKKDINVLVSQMVDDDIGYYPPYDIREVNWDKLNGKYLTDKDDPFYKLGIFV